jgi:hypothetical protein
MATHPLLTDLAQALTFSRVGEKRQQLGGQVPGIVRRRIKGSFAGRHSTFGEVELDDRFSERHIFQDLVHRRLVVHRVDPVGVHANVGR